MNRDEMKTMMGLNSGATAIYKLNKVTMSGDDASFKLTDLTSPRDKGAKPNTETLGEKIEGVILKMRWQLSRFEETGSYNSSEYDDKWKDQVTVYPVKDKGSVSAMKEKYKLSTLRVIYFYIPAKKQVVRLIVKASGLTAEKNTGGELGLFEYTNSFSEDEELPCEYITICSGVFREGKNPDGTPNKRKEHYAMSFARGRKLTEVEFEKVQTLMVEVNEKVNTPEKEEEPEPPAKIPSSYEEEHKDDEQISPDDIPF